MESSEGTVLIVCIPKGDDSVRICRDYKVTINPGLEMDKYLFPKPQDLFAKADRGNEVEQTRLAPSLPADGNVARCKNISVHKTHTRVFRYERLPYGELAHLFCFNE